MLLLAFFACGFGHCSANIAFNFHDYKDVPVENSGWLVLKQNTSTFLPLNFSACVHVYKWYARLKYQSVVTINLLNDEEEPTYQFTLSIAWNGGVALTEFTQQVICVFGLI